MRRSIQLVIGLLTVLAFSVPGALSAAPQTESIVDDADAKCGPPCGYIYPTIGLELDHATPIKTSQIPGLPTSIPLKVTYYWDMDQDGTGVPDNADEMTVTLVITKKPDWASAKLDTFACSFMLVPTNPYYDVCEVNLLLEVYEVPLSEAALNEFGKRIMIFASSEETGTFKKSYGVEDIRFQFDEAPSVDNGLQASNHQVEEASALALFPVMALGALLVARRRYA